MGKLKISDEIIQKNKSELENYFLEFEPSQREEYSKLFEESDFQKGRTSFIGFFKRKIGMPKIGKETINYWIKRGWSEEESERLRIKIKRDPEKSPMNVNFWVKKGYSKEEADFKIKSQRKMNIEYWLERGYSKEEAEKERIKFQKKSSEKFVIKYNTNLEYKKKVDSNRKNSVEYWIKRGYSEEEAIKNISEIQRTFSKDICISKHGLEKGTIIWEERQKKWMESLKNSDYDLSTGKSVTIKHKVERYIIDKLLNSLTLKNRELFRDIFNNSNTIEKFINNYMSKYDTDEISLYRILLPIKRLKLLHEYYNTTESYIMSLIIPKLSRIKSGYSYISWINNHVCRSDGEYMLASFLLKNDIDYIYEKRYYYNSRYRCDFYLTKIDVYIEYMGMEKESYEKKLIFLNENKIKHIASDDIEYLKFKIKELC
jgi:hypothetical protein